MNLLKINSNWGIRRMENSIKSFAESIDRSWVSNTSNIFSSQPIFEHLLKEQVLKNVSEDEYETILAITQDYLVAVKQCRENLLSEAFKKLKDVDSQLIRLSGFSYQIAYLFKLSAWGNYYYKEGSHQKAINLLVVGFKQSAVLEELGVYALIYRRIEQLMNISYVLTASNKALEAIKLLFDSLNFSLFGEANDLYIKKWDYNAYIKHTIISDNNTKVLLQELCFQDSKSIITGDLQKLNYMYRRYEDLLKSIDSRDDYMAALIFNWISVKKEIKHNSSESTIQWVKSFVEDENIDSAFDFLKVNLFIQLEDVIPGHKHAIHPSLFNKLITEKMNIDKKTRLLFNVA